MTYLSVSSNAVDFSDQTSAEFMYRLPVKIINVHPPFVLLDQLDTVILTGENFFDNSDTGLLYVRLTRELTNDDDTKLVHTVL